MLILIQKLNNIECAFTDIFFSDVHLLNFINYIYNVINSYIMSNLNKHLKINKYDLLYK